MKRKGIAVILLLALLTAGCARAPDAAKQMPHDFTVCFSWWYEPERKNLMDTESGIVQKDLVMDGTASAAFEPDEELMQRLYDMVSADSFLMIEREMTARELTTDGTMAGVSPNMCYEVAVTLNGEQFVVRGDQTAAAYAETDEDAARFAAVTDELLRTVRELPEWTALPEADGAYA